MVLNERWMITLRLKMFRSNITKIYIVVLFNPYLGVGWLVGFYGTSIFVGYSEPNPLLNT